MTKIIALFGTGTAFKVDSLKKFLSERSSNFEVHFLSDLNIPPHTDPEETGFFAGNLDGKVLENVRTLLKLNYKIDDIENNSLDSTVLYQLGIDRDDILSGRVRVPIISEDSGIIIPSINGDIRELILENPSAFGELEELVTGLVKDKFIEAAFDKGFPGVETSPFLSALGKENAIKFLDIVCRLKGLEARPSAETGIENAMQIIQQSYLTYFLYYPGMDLDAKNLPALHYKTINSSVKSYYTGRILDETPEGYAFDIDDIMLPESLVLQGDYRSNAEAGFPFRGPLCRFVLFEEMYADILSSEFFNKSLKDKAIARPPREDTLLLGERTYDIALISPSDSEEHREIKRRLQLQLPRSYKVNEYFTSEILDVSGGRSLYENLSRVGNEIVTSNDCFILGPRPHILHPAEDAAFIAHESELITHKLVSPEHRNKHIIYINHQNCHSESLSTLTAMANNGALADAIEWRGEERLAKVINSVNVDEIRQHLLKRSRDYFRVDFDKHGYVLPLEKVTPYQPDEYEIVSSIYCSAGMRGAYYDLLRQATALYLKNDDTISWGLGDKICAMGGVNDAIAAMRDLFMDRKGTGSSTKTIMASETRNGRNIPGITEFRVYDSLMARTFDILLSGHRDNFHSGGEGTRLELAVRALQYHVEGRESPVLVSTFSKQDPIYRSAERMLGNANFVHYVDGTKREILQAVGKFIAGGLKQQGQLAA